MRTLGLTCCALILIACEKPKEQTPAADTSAAMAPAPAPAAPAPISLADVAGKWKIRVMPENSDSAILTYEMVADTTGWTLNLPKRKPVKAKVSASGDSIMAEAGPYESALRKGIQVKTNGVYRLKDGKLVGTTVAHYETKGPDTVRTLRVEGTKAQ
jgi:hypothetical protein